MAFASPGKQPISPISMVHPNEPDIKKMLTPSSFNDKSEMPWHKPRQPDYYMSYECHEFELLLNIAKKLIHQERASIQRLQKIEDKLLV